MKNLKYLCGLIGLLVAVALAEKVSYEGYKLIRLYPITFRQRNLIHELESKDPKFDVWADGPNQPVDVLLPPDLLASYSMYFVAKKIPFQVINENIRETIDEETKSMAKASEGKDKSARKIVYKYARHNEINNYIDEVAELNSDIASKFSAGTTLERRDIQVLVIDPKKSARALWIDCGIHAREWVAPATCIYAIDKLIKDYRNGDPETVSILDNYALYIMPVVNPDGYEYSHTTDRLWRKNRKPNPGSVCVGTDLNRNFPFNWNVPGVSSTNPCSETYGGANAASENEPQAIMNAINSRAGQWDAYITVHSYGQLWLVPFGYSATDKPLNDAKIRAAATVGANAIKDYNGTVFTVGSSAEVLYLSSGSSRDWANGQAGIQYSNTLELRPSRTGPDSTFGFVWPEDRLPIVVEETFYGIKTFFNYIISNP